MQLLKKLLIVALPLLVWSVAADAMVSEGNVISGLPPNTVVVLDLGPTSVEAVTDRSGTVRVTNDEDDVDGGALFIPDGSKGEWQLRDKISGSLLGTVKMSAGTLSVASLAGSLAEEYKAWRLFVGLGASQYSSDDLKTNVFNGGGEAEAQGFDVAYSTEDDVLGGYATVGVAWNGGKPWHKKGSNELQLSVSYFGYEDIKGKFTASGPGLTIKSSGKQEIESWQVAVGAHFFVADDFSLSAEFGYARYDLKDSGDIVRLEDGEALDNFSDSRNDETGTFALGFAYYFCDGLSFNAAYQWSFDEVGSSESETPELYLAGLRYAF